MVESYLTMINLTRTLIIFWVLSSCQWQDDPSLSLVIETENNSPGLVRWTNSAHYSLSSFLLPAQYISIGARGFRHPRMTHYPIDGQYQVVVESDAIDLINNQINLENHIYLIRRPGDNVLISKNPRTGAGGNAPSSFPHISGDGRFIVFSSEASNLVATDKNGFADIFFLDRDPKNTGVLDQEPFRLERVSLNNEGKELNASSHGAIVSNDGRYVVFASEANNLVKNDVNGTTDIFLYDRQLKKIKLISRSLSGSPANNKSRYANISSSPLRIVFESQATNLVPDQVDGKSQIYMYDLATDEIKLISKNPIGQMPNQESTRPMISHSARYVIYESLASNLVENDTNFNPLNSQTTGRDIFIFDYLSNDVKRVNLSENGEQADRNCGYSAIGGQDNNIYAYFTCSARNLVALQTTGLQLYRHQLNSGETILVSQVDGQVSNGQSNGGNLNPSADGKSVVFMVQGDNLFPSDNNKIMDLMIFETGP